MNKTTLFLFLLFVLAGCRSDQKEQRIESILGPNFSEKDLDGFIEAQMTALDMPGLSLAIINNGKVVYHTVKGFADKEKNIPVSGTTIFEGASISKSVFGYFVMTFVEEGTLDLDKPLYQYFPYPDIEDDERYKKITAQMVLSHRSGFPNWRDDYEANKLFIQFEPGTDYHYSGEGYQYLALVLKHLLNTDWAGLEDEFQKRVAIPFQMEHTRFIQDDFIRENKAVPYDKQGNRIDKSTMAWWQERDSVFVAPTTLHSEAIDFSKWVIAMINEEGLTKEGFKTLFQTHSEISGDAMFKNDYSLGFGKTTLLDSKTFYSHNGNNTGFSSLFLFDKDSKWGLVYFTNSEFGDAFGNKLIYEFLLTGWSLEKQKVIVALIILALLLLLVSAFMVFRKKSSLSVVRQSNLLLAVLILFTAVLTFSFLFFNSLEISHVYGIAVFLLGLIVILSLQSLKKTGIAWKRQDGSKLEMVFQFLLSFGVLVLIALVLIF